MGFEAYEAYLSINPSLASSPVNYFKGQLQAISDSVFEISSTFFMVKHRQRITSTPLAATPVWVDVGVRLVRPYDVKQTNLIKDDLFNVIFKNFDYDVLLGDIFEFNNYRWLVINTSNMRSITNSVLVQRCNAVLKFTESTPLSSNIISIDCIASKQIIKNLKDDQFIILPDNKLSVQIPNDILGEKIKWAEKGGTRFLLGKPYQNWKVQSYDNITLSRITHDNLIKSGIIKLQLELSQINSAYDDLVNGIAWQDYFDY